ncbi:unnamed protein product [Rotaria magnacalcarata]|uniref:Uncharacterized protein n=1 Tax=Rotaria magnacalcarata TaxID=392030 RepID=A0A8S3E0W0_9BILA|nr:unnamed protein product [Rotaria magnacalcarata]
MLEEEKDDFSSKSSTYSIDDKEFQDKNTKLLKSNDGKAISSSLLMNLLHSQAKNILSAVLVLTRQNEIDYNNETNLRYSRPLSPINDKQQMQLVKNIAVVVRDLLQTIDRAPIFIKEMSEQNYNHFSNLVVSLIEAVRQRNYDKMGEHAVDIARTAKVLLDDILKLA